MLTLAQLREAAGGPDGLSDEEIIAATYPRYKKYFPTSDDYAKEIGYEGAGRGKNASRMSSSVDSFQSNLYGAAGATGRAMGLPASVTQWADQKRNENQGAADYASQRAKDLGAVDDWRDIRGPGDAIDYTTGVAIGSLPQMAGMAAGGLAGFAVGGPVGAAVGATAMNYPSYVGSNLQAQREQNGQEDLLSAAAYAVPQAAIDAVTGVGSLVTRPAKKLVAGEIARGLPRRVLTKGAETAAEESAGELAQQYAEQGARMAVDPNEQFFSDPANKRAADSVVGGIALGGVFGGAAGLRRPKGPAVAPPVNDAPGQSTDILGIGYSPIPGTPVVFPDGSTAVGTDQELMARYNMAPDQLARLRAGAAPNTDPNMAVPPARAAAPALPATMVADQAGAVATNAADANALYGQDEGDPGLAEARRRYMAQQQAAEAEKAAIAAHAAEFAGRRQRAHDELVDKNPDGTPMIQLKPQDVALHNDIQTLQVAGAITPEQGQAFKGAMQEALRADDKKAVNAVRKAVEEIKNPKPVAEAKPAPAPKPAPKVEAKAAPVAAKPATPAPVAAPKPAPAAPVSPAATVVAPTETPAAPAPAAPVAAPTPAPAEAKVTDFAAYAGRPVSIEVANPNPDGKPIRRAIKDAGAALTEANDRAAKFAELARCIANG